MRQQEKKNNPRPMTAHRWAPAVLGQKAQAQAQELDNVVQHTNSSSMYTSSTFKIKSLQAFASAAARLYLPRSAEYPHSQRRRSPLVLVRAAACDAFPARRRGSRSGTPRPHPQQKRVSLTPAVNLVPDGFHDGLAVQGVAVRKRHPRYKAQIEQELDGVQHLRLIQAQHLRICTIQNTIRPRTHADTVVLSVNNNQNSACMIISCSSVERRQQHERGLKNTHVFDFVIGSC